ncbi:hypothetical protein C443_00507 [Haloarcula argentinensis DSM 12282]|nr:hypothetical protein C443_00507 [Haloarcula argentinensis DSM 12282]
MITRTGGAGTEVAGLDQRDSTGLIAEVTSLLFDYLQSLPGVGHDDQEVMFRTMVENDTIDEFKSMIEESVTSCHQKHS